MNDHTREAEALGELSLKVHSIEVPACLGVVRGDVERDAALRDQAGFPRSGGWRPGRSWSLR